jgi:hypothetical protein
MSDIVTGVRVRIRDCSIAKQAGQPLGGVSVVMIGDCVQ